MNNTSAYANVLLKTSTAAPVVARPDFQERNSADDFHQTLKSVHDAQHRKNDKASAPAHAKPSAKKETPVDHRSDVKRSKEIKDTPVNAQSNVERKPLNDSRGVDKKPIEESSIQDLPHKLIDEHEDASAEDSGLALSNSSIGSDLDDTQEYSGEVPLGIAVSAVPTQPNVGLSLNSTEPSPSSAPELRPLAEIAATQERFGSSQPTSLFGTSFETQVGVINTSPETEQKSGLASTPTLSEMSAQAVGKINQQPLFNESSIVESLSQPLGVNSLGIASNQPINPVMTAETQGLIAESLTSASSLKAMQSQVAVPGTFEVGGDAEELASSPVADSVTIAKTTSTINSPLTGNKVSPEVAMVSNDAPAPAPNSNGSSGPSHSMMDSLMRNADQQTPAARNFLVQTSVSTPVGQPQWSQAVGEKVLWLAAQNVTSAEINLHPKDLGPMQVRVSVNQEQTTVSFTSHHAVVREVLDQNLGRLRDMFSEQGLNLVNVDVSDKSFSRQQGDSQNPKGSSGTQGVAAEEETTVAVTTIGLQRLVDHYA